MITLVPYASWYALFATTKKAAERWPVWVWVGVGGLEMVPGPFCILQYRKTHLPSMPTRYNFSESPYCAYSATVLFLPVLILSAVR